MHVSVASKYKHASTENSHRITLLHIYIRQKYIALIKKCYYDNYLFKDRLFCTFEINLCFNKELFKRFMKIKCTNCQFSDLHP